jgi:hypothetical protein
MERHFNDVEESFLPAPSPIGLGEGKGADDTYLFDGAQPSPRGRNTSEEFSITSGNTATISKEHADQLLPRTGPRVHRIHAPQQQDFPEDTEDTTEAGNTTSSLETMSSPTVAAAARTISRSTSTATVGGYETANDGCNPHSQEQTDEEEDVQATPKKKKKVKGMAHIRNQKVVQRFDVISQTRVSLSMRGAPPVLLY